MKKNLILAYAPEGNGSSIAPFNRTFDIAVDARKKGFAVADAFILWGGADIHPSLYGAERNSFSQAYSMPSQRDLFEWSAIKHCKFNNIPIIGICRGAQMLCAAAGGKLIQHVHNHVGGHHEVTTRDGEMFQVTSCHHQMMDLEGTRHELLAWSSKPRSDIYYGEHCETPQHIAEGIAAGTFVEPEMVYFPELNALAIQGHPEWAQQGDFADWCNQAVQQLLLEKVSC